MAALDFLYTQNDELFKSGFDSIINDGTKSFSTIPQDWGLNGAVETKGKLANVSPDGKSVSYANDKYDATKTADISKDGGLSVLKQVALNNGADATTANDIATLGVQATAETGNKKTLEDWLNLVITYGSRVLTVLYSVGIIGQKTDTNTVANADVSSNLALKKTASGSDTTTKNWYDQSIVLGLTAKDFGKGALIGLGTYGVVKLATSSTAKPNRKRS